MYSSLNDLIANYEASEEYSYEDYMDYIGYESPEFGELDFNDDSDYYDS